MAISKVLNMYNKWNTYTKSDNYAKQNQPSSYTQERATDHEESAISYSANDEDLKSINIVDQYLRDIRKVPLLTKEEELYYARQAKQGHEFARKKMVESNLRLVVKIARRYLRSDVQLLDLIEEGNLGLMHAVEKFDPEKGFRFTTYSAWWIQQNIERAIMNQSRTVRIPVHVVKKMNAFYRIRRDLAKTLDHEPTILELAEASSQPQKNIEHLLTLSEKALSIDTSGIDGNENTALCNIQAKRSEDPSYIYSMLNISDHISVWLDKLSPKHKNVLICRFGLLGTEPKTLDQTGFEVGVTRERVRQIQTEALKQLKSLIESDGESKVNLLSQ